MYLELKENKVHGTKEYPYCQYFIHDKCQAFQSPVHWHDEFEIIYIKQGKLDIYISDRHYPGLCGSIYFVNPKELHFMGSEDLSVAYYTLLFPLEFISFQSDDLLETELLRPLRNGTLQFSHNSGHKACNEKISTLLDKIVSLNAAVQPYENLSALLQIRILLLDIIVELFRDTNFFKERVNGAATIFQRELLAFIDEHFAEPLSLGTLARQFHLSEKYISRYFKEHFHITFIQYLNHHRLMQSQKLLETTDISITEVALCSGFSNVSYFIRTFKKAYGISPLKYRRLL